MLGFHNQFSEITYYIRVYIDRKVPNSPELFCGSNLFKVQAKKLRELFAVETILTDDEKNEILSIFNEEKAQAWAHSDFRTIINGLPNKKMIPSVLQFNLDQNRYYEVGQLKISGNQYGYDIKMAMSDVYGGPGMDFLIAIDLMKKLLGIPLVPTNMIADEVKDK